MNAAQGAWPVYSLYGITLTGNFPFTTPLSPAEPSLVSPGMLQVICVTSPPLDLDWTQLRPVALSRTRLANGEPWLTCYEVGECEVRRIAHIADFYLYHERILCHILAPEKMIDAEIALLGAILARWLERRGTAMLHASAVATEAGAVAFLATSQSGKSTLAASFVDAGYALLTDDILPVEQRDDAVLAAPGYPQMRMWPEVAAHFLGEYEHLPLVHPAANKRRVRLGAAHWGVFCLHPQPLAAIYLPERGDAGTADAAITIAPCGRAEALFTLSAHSFAGPHVNSIVRQQQRIALLRTVVQRVPVYRLRYPSGYAHLPAVRQAILANLESMPHRRLHPVP